MCFREVRGIGWPPFIRPNKMPISSYTILPTLAHELHCRAPKTVLDLGIGLGMYGMIVRQYIDMGVQPYKTKLIGVEVWDRYENPVWQLYDNIYNITIEKFLERDKQTWDCIIIADVIEHFPKFEALKLIEELKTRLSGCGILLLSTPAWFNPQGAEYGNKYETHLCLFEIRDLVEQGFKILKDGTPDFGHKMIVAKYTA